MLTRLERDRAVGQVMSLQATLKSLHGGTGEGIPTDPPTRAASRQEGALNFLEEVVDTSQLSKKCKYNYGILSDLWYVIYNYSKTSIREHLRIRNNSA